MRLLKRGWPFLDTTSLRRRRFSFFIEILVLQFLAVLSCVGSGLLFLQFFVVVCFVHLKYQKQNLHLNSSFLPLSLPFLLVCPCIGVCFSSLCSYELFLFKIISCDSDKAFFLFVETKVMGFCTCCRRVKS